MRSRPLCVVMLVLATAAISQAQTIFSNLSPDPLGSGHDWVLNGSPTSFEALAAGFTPSTTCTVGNVIVPLQYWSGTNDFVVSLAASNSSGTPDMASLLYSWGNVAVGSTVESLAPSSLVTLTGGNQYWLVVTPGASDTLGSWNQTYPDAYTSPMAVCTDGTNFSVMDHSSSSSWGYWSLAFEVDGPNGATTPEPFTLILGGAALALAALRRRH